MSTVTINLHGPSKDTKLRYVRAALKHYLDTIPAKEEDIVCDIDDGRVTQLHFILDERLHEHENILDVIVCDVIVGTPLECEQIADVMCARWKRYSKRGVQVVMITEEITKISPAEVKIEFPPVVTRIFSTSYENCWKSLSQIMNKRPAPAEDLAQGAEDLDKLCVPSPPVKRQATREMLFPVDSVIAPRNLLELGIRFEIPSEWNFNFKSKPNEKQLATLKCYVEGFGERLLSKGIKNAAKGCIHVFIDDISIFPTINILSDTYKTYRYHTFDVTEHHIKQTVYEAPWANDIWKLSIKYEERR